MVQVLTGGGTWQGTGTRTVNLGGFPIMGTLINQQPPVAFSPSLMTIMVDAPIPGGSFAIQMNVNGGSQNGTTICQAQISAGQTTANSSFIQNIHTDATSIHFDGINNTSGSGTWVLNYTVIVTYNDLAPPPSCQYGTQPAPTSSLVTLITDTAVTAAVTALGAPWLSILFDPLIGYALDTGVLCGTGPPAVGTITPQSLLENVEQKLEMLQAIMWYSICQCTPAPSGQPPPIVFPPPTLVIPPGWPTRPTYTCSNSDICTTLELILKRLDELNGSQQVNVNQTTTIVNSTPGLQYKVGPSHTGLQGSASISVSGLVGLRLTCTTLPAGLTLPGNPPYLWDVGWCSVSDGGAMLQEKRVTRTEFEWFPPEMVLASTFGYYLNDGVQATMTELQVVT